MSAHTLDNECLAKEVLHCSISLKRNKKLDLLGLKVKNASEEKKKQHICDICGASFYRKDFLQNHYEAVHEEKRPWKCNICGNTFAYKGSLTIHTQTVHERKRPYKCSTCDGAFATRQSLNIHIESVHEKKKPHKCVKNQN